MSKPEIARRCPVCGASIREAAFFCPQCGEQLIRQDLEEKPSTSMVTTPLDESSAGSVEPTNKEASGAPKLETLAETIPLDELSASRVEPTNKEASDASKLETLAETIPLHELSADRDEPWKPEASEAKKLETLEASATPPLETSAEKTAVGKVRDKIQRATTLARDVEGDVKNRVQKMRQISNVVLDEAGYDPSLRFVLVAAALFLLFLLVLLLNKLIT